MKSLRLLRKPLMNNDQEKEDVEMKENFLIDKSIAFASRIIKLYQYLIKTKKETIVSKQIVRYFEKCERYSMGEIP